MLSGLGLPHCMRVHQLHPPTLTQGVQGCRTLQAHVCHVARTIAELAELVCLLCCLVLCSRPWTCSHIHPPPTTCMWLPSHAQQQEQRKVASAVSPAATVFTNGPSSGSTGALLCSPGRQLGRTPASQCCRVLPGGAGLRKNPLSEQCRGRLHLPKASAWVSRWQTCRQGLGHRQSLVSAGVQQLPWGCLW